MKRAFDIVFSLIVLLVFLPIGLVVGVLLRLTGEGEVFYLQPRIGRGGKKFGLIKFATMLKNSPNIGTGSVTVKSDPRVLPMGGILRKTKLNEMPQFINVLMGTMSLVGPRPMTEQTFGYYNFDVQEDIKSLAPGLTGVGSIVFRDEETILDRLNKAPLDAYKEDIAPYKGKLEQWYRANQSFGMDMKIVILTSWSIIRPNNDLYRKWLKNLPEMPATLQNAKE